jgi:hypothetical protein
MMPSIGANPSIGGQGESNKGRLDIGGNTPVEFEGITLGHGV